MIRLLLFIALLAGCVPPAIVRDRDSACRVARSMLRQSMSGPDLIEVSTPFPRANVLAKRAYHSRIAALVLTGFGAAGLAGGFVTGFAADTSQYPVRIGLYSDVGVTIGLGAGALLAGFLALKAHAGALAELDAATRAECP